MKILLLIPIAILEVLFVLVCWVAAITHKPTAKKLIQWGVNTFPDKEWYFS